MRIPTDNERRLAIMMSGVTKDIREVQYAAIGAAISTTFSNDSGAVLGNNTTEIRLYTKSLYGEFNEHAAVDEALFMAIVGKWLGDKTNKIASNKYSTNIMEFLGVYSVFGKSHIDKIDANFMIFNNVYKLTLDILKTDRERYKPWN